MGEHIINSDCHPDVLQDVPDSQLENDGEGTIPPEGIAELSEILQIANFPPSSITSNERTSPSISSSIGTTKNRPEIVSLATTSQIEQSQIEQPFLESSSRMANATEFAPKILAHDDVIFYNVPSSFQMRNMSKAIGVEFNRDGLKFWGDTLEWISQFNGASQPAKFHKIITPEIQMISGFASLALFLTGNEKHAFKIQQVVKTYFYQNFVSTGASTKLSDEIVLETFVTNDLNDIYLTSFANLFNLIVGVFDDGSLKIYGTHYQHSPTILLNKEGNVFSPVVSVK